MSVCVCACILVPAFLPFSRFFAVYILELERSTVHDALITGGQEERPVLFLSVLCPSLFPTRLQLWIRCVYVSHTLFLSPDSPNTCLILSFLGQGKYCLTRLLFSCNKKNFILSLLLLIYCFPLPFFTLSFLVAITAEKHGQQERKKDSYCLRLSSSHSS